MSDVFILGAGFSKAASISSRLQMPLLAELADQVKELLILNKKKHPVCDLFPRDLELWLSFLLDDHPWLTEDENLKNRAIGQLVLSTIRNRLFVAEFVTTVRLEWFTNLVDYWRLSQASVLTLNYDTLVDRCATSFGISLGDLYPVPLISLRQRVALVEGKPTFKLFKLHGSASWFFSDAEPEAIHYIPFESWGDRAEDIPDLAKGKKEFIVPPRFNKASYLEHRTMHHLWSLAAEALRVADRVFVLGYSLPPTDIEMRYFLATNARRNEQEIYVVDKNPEVVQRFSAVFGDSRIHDNTDGSGNEEPIPQLANALHFGRL